MRKNGEETRQRILDTTEDLVFRQGFSGTSVNDIVGAAGLTKGAFFHHFADKATLARSVLERWAAKDYAVFKDFADRAAALAEEPLQEVLLFFKLMEEWLEGLDEPDNGCLFASFTYEREQFDPDTHAYIAAALAEWTGLYAEKFEKLMAARPPKVEGVTARDLAELSASVIEGGLVLSRAYGDPQYLARSSRQLRTYIGLLFG